MGPLRPVGRGSQVIRQGQISLWKGALNLVHQSKPMAQVHRNGNEKQVHQSRQKRLGKSCALFAQGGPVLVQVCLHGRNPRRFRKGQRYLQEVDGMGSRGKSLDGLHQILGKNGRAPKGQGCLVQVSWGKSHPPNLPEGCQILVQKQEQGGGKKDLRAYYRGSGVWGHGLRILYRLQQVWDQAARVLESKGDHEIRVEERAKIKGEQTLWTVYKLREGARVKGRDRRGGPGRKEKLL